MAEPPGMEDALVTSGLPGGPNGVDFLASFRLMRLICLLLPALTLGCLDAVSTAASNATPAVTRSVGEVGGQRAFNAGLTPRAESRGAGGSSARSFARGRVQIKVRRDATLEYRLTINNPAGETFTSAHIHRNLSGADGPVVFTLFSSASIRDKHIEVRGTASLEPQVATSLLQELQSKPSAFYVSVRSARSPQGAIRGAVK